MNDRWLLAIDPGVKTGLVVVDLKTASQCGMYELDQRSTCDYVDALLSEYRGALHVVIERFVINMGTAKKNPPQASIEIIGVARWLAERYSAASFTVQSQSAATKFVDGKKLRELGFWLPKSDGHANIAARHALLWMSERDLVHPSKLLTSEYVS